MEIQIHTNLKSKVAVDDITLWVNRSMKCHGNTISCFHLIVHYLSRVWIFHRELYSVTPAAFQHNFWSARNNPNLNSWPFESTINRLWQIVEYYCGKFQVILIRGFCFIVLTYIHAYTHIMTKWSQYPCCHSTLLVQIINVVFFLIHDQLLNRLWSIL